MNFSVIRGDQTFDQYHKALLLTYYGVLI
jgi:hypothetical protein